MCGRLTLGRAKPEIEAAFDLPLPFDVAPRFNISPQQPVLCITASDPPYEPTRKWGWFNWGLVPAWSPAATKKVILTTANAGAAALQTEIAYAFRHRRCLIIADGFYLWRNAGAGKQPFYLQLTGGAPFALAGVWEAWTGAAGGEELRTCAILTVRAVREVKPIQHTMPLIVETHLYDRWLDPDLQSTGDLQDLIESYRTDITVTRVSRLVNNPLNDSVECTAALVRKRVSQI